MPKTPHSPEPPPPTPDDGDLLDLAKLDRAWGLSPGTTARMRRMYRPGGRYPNHPFPDPDVVVGGRPAWYWRTASTWRANMPRNMDGGGVWRRATRDDDTGGDQT